MKKMLAVLLAVAMMFSTAVIGFAADATANNPVTDIDSHAYLIDDDDGGVDMTEDVDMVPYGETVYFPLLSSGGSSYDQDAVDDITAAFNTHKSAKDGVDSEALTAAKNNNTNWYLTATGVDSDKKAVYDAAKAANTSDASDEFTISGGPTDNDLYKGSNAALSGLTRGEVKDLATKDSSYYEIQVPVEDADKKAEVEAAKAADTSASSDEFTVQGGTASNSDVYCGTDSALSGMTRGEVKNLASKDESYYTTEEEVEDPDKKATWENADDLLSDESNYEDPSDPSTYKGFGDYDSLKAIVDQGSDYYTTTEEVIDEDLKAEVEAAKNADTSDSSDEFTIEGGGATDSDPYCGSSSYLSGMTRGEVKDLASKDASYYTTYTPGEDADKKAEVEAAKATNTSDSSSEFTVTGGTATDSDPYCGSNSKLSGKTRGQVKEIVAEGTDYYKTTGEPDNAKKAKYDAAVSYLNGAYKTWENTVDSFNSEYSKSYTTETALASFVDTIKKAGSSTGFKYVYEKEAAGNMKVSKKWEEGSSYVDSVSVVRKKISSDSYDHIGATSSSMKYLYFLAIEIDSSTSTSTRDLFGTVTIEQKGNKDYAEVDEIDFDVNLELGYDSASSVDTEGEIPITPATFREGNGFEADSEFEFTFEADGSSFFIVNTNGQGRIVLAMDTEFDDDFADDYPDADLYFFNGNYATFNRLGELYLSSEDDDLYVYAIDEDGSVSKVSAEYDDSEEAYVIKTRTLGRYVLSDTKLTVKSSSSSAPVVTTPSSSRAPVASVPSYSTPSYTAPSSTYTPPVSSTPPSSSEPESSEPPEEEEPEEPEEPEDIEEEEEVIDVVVDDEENEEPEKKKGLSGLTWALIIAGVAAVPIAIGAVYFIQNRPSSRDYFDDDDEYDDDDYED